MPLFTVKLTRQVAEVATVEVEADSEVHAVNLAFKEIDRLKDKSQDKCVRRVAIQLAPVEDNIWEEQSVEKI